MECHDTHMQETPERLLDFHGSEAKGIVRAHNTHSGEAAFTDMVDDGMYNIGGLAREHFGEKNVVLVGFGSIEGPVIAGKRRGAEMQIAPDRKVSEAAGKRYCMMHLPKTCCC